jgi:hypothetical protein
MPGSSDFSISPMLLLILMPFRSKGIWLPLTITPAPPFAIARETNAGVGILPAFSTKQPQSRIACIQALMMRSVLGRRSPARMTSLVAGMSPMLSRYRSAPLTLM